MPRLEGRVAIVSGAGAGIGEAVARRLAAEGSTVAVLDRDGGAADRVASSICADGGAAIGIAADVCERVAVRDAIARAAEINGKVDIVINNAGVTRTAMFADLREDDFRAVIDVHLMGTYAVCQEVLPYLRDDGGGRIINSTSAAGIVGTVGQANYGAAKAAIIGLTKSLARELARIPVTVNAIAPLAATAMTEVVRNDPRFAEQALNRVPLRRWATPTEIAGSFAFLASDDAGYITGQVLCVDGGLVI